MMLIFMVVNQFVGNWIAAMFVQAGGHIVVTFFLIEGYYTKLDIPTILVPVLNFNVGLVISAFLYFESDQQTRNLSFLKWTLEKELKTWKRMVNTLPTGIIISNDTEIVYVNKAAVKTLCPDFEFLEAKQLNEKITDTLKHVEKHQALQNCGTKVQSLYDFLYVNKCESHTELKSEKYTFLPSNSARALPLSINTTRFKRGDVTYKVVALMDQSIYEELEAERLHAKYQKSFFAMLTHELRNPLHGVLGILEALESDDIPSHLKHSCRLALNTGQLMMCLINDILDLSQMDANKFKLAVNEFVPKDVVNECLDIMKFQYEKKRVTLTAKYAPNMPLCVTNDKNRYKQILLNLLGNALKFTNHGYVCVKLLYDQEGQKLLTKVKDTGSGIKKEDQQKLFSMYGKLDSAVNPTGVGLGLLICKKLTDIMGGTISLKSDIGRGTTFKFVIEDRKNTESPRLSSGFDLKSSSVLLSPQPRLERTEDDVEEIVADEAVSGIKIRTSSCHTPSLRGITSLRTIAKERVSNDLSTFTDNAQVLVVDDDYTCAFVVQNYFKSQHILCDLVFFLFR